MSKPAPSHERTLSRVRSARTDVMTPGPRVSLPPQEADASDVRLSGAEARCPDWGCAWLSLATPDGRESNCLQMGLEGSLRRCGCSAKSVVLVVILCCLFQISN